MRWFAFNYSVHTAHATSVVSKRFQPRGVCARADARLMATLSLSAKDLQRLVPLCTLLACNRARKISPSGEPSVTGVEINWAVCGATVSYRYYLLTPNAGSKRIGTKVRIGQSSSTDGLGIPRHCPEPESGDR